MNYIEKKARNLAEREFEGRRFDEADDLIKMVRNDLYGVDSESDKLSYLTIVLEANDLAYNDHLKVCTYPEGCTINEAHEAVNYYLQQELNKIGVKTNEDAFTREEKETLTDYLDKFASDLKDLKDGQQVIYEDLLEEIEELKKWFLMGKKNWRQLAVGKVGEMIVGGVISESTAKPLLSTLKEGVQNLPGS